MKSTAQALNDGFMLTDVGGDIPLGYFSFKFGDGYELCFEPLMFDRMYVALYQNQGLLTEKVVVRPVVKT